MTIDKANKELNKLYNDLNYYNNRLISLLSLVLPKSTDMINERVDGGNRIDKFLKYVELEDKDKLEATIVYIQKQITDLEMWKRREIDRLNQYEEWVQEAVFLRENEFVIDKWSGKKRHLKWEEIAKKMHCSKRSAINYYNEGIKKR